MDRCMAEESTFIKVLSNTIKAPHSGSRVGVALQVPKTSKCYFKKTPTHFQQSTVVSGSTPSGSTQHAP